MTFSKELIASITSNIFSDITTKGNGGIFLFEAVVSTIMNFIGNTI